MKRFLLSFAALASISAIAAPAQADCFSRMHNVMKQYYGERNSYEANQNVANAFMFCERIPQLMRQGYTYDEAFHIVHSANVYH